MKKNEEVQAAAQKALEANKKKQTGPPVRSLDDGPGVRGCFGLAGNQAAE